MKNRERRLCANCFQEHWRTRNRGGIVGLDRRSTVNQLPAGNQTPSPSVCPPETAQIHGRGSPFSLAKVLFTQIRSQCLVVDLCRAEDRSGRTAGCRRGARRRARRPPPNLRKSEATESKGKLCEDFVRIVLAGGCDRRADPLPRPAAVRRIRSASYTSDLRISSIRRVRPAATSALLVASPASAAAS
jgi:hypothetical protein